MPLTSLPIPPTRADPANFAARADAFLSALPLFVTQLNAGMNVIEADADTATAGAATATTQAGIAVAAAATASAAASNAGVVAVAANLAGSNTIGTVAGSISNVNAVGADIAAIVAVYSSLANINAAAADLPSLAAKASLTGATFSGHINVPAGATGNQAPRASETAILSVANSFTTTQAAQTTGTVGVGNASPNHQFEVRNTSTGAAAIRFHRVGLYASFLGIDGIDNNLVWGGGSAGTARRKIYHEGVIIGTVSQSGGTPTGAIIETGSNANGRYVRWADGTQICWHSEASNRAVNSAVGNIFISATANFTFPAAFVAAPLVTPTATNSSVAPCWADNSGPNTTTTGPIYGFGPQNTATVALGYVAYGRWY